MATISTLQWKPDESPAHRIVLLLDHEGVVLSAESSVTEASPEKPSALIGISVHEFLHPGCAGNCNFDRVWGKAHGQLQHTDFVEWELQDQTQGKLLRLNLAPRPSDREGDRRQRMTLLTIRDITQYRKSHDSLRQREEELVALVRQQGIDLASANSRLENNDEVVKGDKELLAEFDKKIRYLSRSLIMAQENERKRISLDLHDGIAQNLTMLKYGIETSIEELNATNYDLDLRTLKGVADQARIAIEEVRRISWDLAPTMLDNLGLQDAIELLCQEFDGRHSHIKVTCSLCIDGRCLGEKETPNLVSTAMYRVVQEGLSNAIKHAGASHIAVSIEELGDGVTLTISDDGKGIDTNDLEVESDQQSGLGLGSMRERVSATGGQFKISSAPDGGTVIRARWSERDLQLLTD